MRVLATGGLGFIGAHTCVELAREGSRLVIVDNLSNAKPSVLDRIRELAPDANIDFVRADIRDAAALDRVLAAGDIDAVIHFAGLKAVGESAAKPLEYYDNNVGGTITLLLAMARHGVERLVFSSSATVYGEPERLPLTEDHRLQATNPYGRTKLMIEQIIVDHAAARPAFRHATLRYFNPIGAHASGRIGEDPRGVPNNLFPYLTQVAVGRLPRLRIFGGDYKTVDGTGVRDYIHVVDLAAGHLAALKYLRARDRSILVNLGTGRGYSVLEVVKAFETATGKKVPYDIVERRPGDSAASYADTSFAATELGWKTKFGIEDMCRDAWRWQSTNPDGYPD
jgi:UDP-glucose 4-epimerase